MRGAITTARARSVLVAAMGVRPTLNNPPLLHRYVKWTQEAFPAAGGKEHLLKALEAATKAMSGVERYYDDPRFLRLWIQYVSAAGLAGPGTPTSRSGRGLRPARHARRARPQARPSPRVGAMRRPHRLKRRGQHARRPGGR